MTTSQRFDFSRDDPPVLDRAETTRRTDRAIATAKAHTDPHERDDYMRAILRLAQTKRAFTADAVWELLDRPEGRSRLGPCMREAARREWIRRSVEGDAPSERPSTHGRILRGWVSLLYKGN